MAERAEIQLYESLTPLMKRFCEEWMVDYNGTAAAIRAGYSDKAASAAVVATENLKKPAIQAYIRKLEEERALQNQVTHERIKLEYARIAFSNPVELFKQIAAKGGKINPTGTITLQTVEDLDLIPIPLQHAIKSIKSSKTGIEVVFHDKLGALEGLGKHTGFFEADNAQRKSDGIGIVAITLPDNGRGDVVITPKQAKDNLDAEDIQSF